MFSDPPEFLGGEAFFGFFFLLFFFFFVVSIVSHCAVCEVALASGLLSPFERERAREREKQRALEARGVASLNREKRVFLVSCFVTARVSSSLLSSSLSRVVDQVPQCGRSRVNTLAPLHLPLRVKLHTQRHRVWSASGQSNNDDVRCLGGEEKGSAILLHHHHHLLRQGFLFGKKKGDDEEND